MHVRIAQRGWRGDHATEHEETPSVGLGIVWVDLITDDGREIRTTDVITAGPVMFENGFTSLPLDVIGTMEVVYVDADGNELAPRPSKQSVRMATGNARRRTARAAKIKREAAALDRERKAIAKRKAQAEAANTRMARKAIAEAKARRKAVLSAEAKLRAVAKKKAKAPVKKAAARKAKR